MATPVKNGGKVEFCLPVYNEEKILEKNTLRLLDHCRRSNLPFPWSIVLLVNGSTDNSYAISRKLAEKFPGVVSAHNYPLPGRGRALKEYYGSSSADIIAYMDSDLAVSLDNLPALVEPIISGQADLVIGSRLLPESKIKRKFIRELSSQTYNFLSKVLLNHKFSDMQCGFKAIRTDVFRKISPFIQDEKWFFDTELVAFCHCLNYRIKEIPVDWSENRWDERESKVNLLRDSSRFIMNLVKLKIRLHSSRNV